MENAFIKSPYGGMKSNFAFIYKSKQKKIVTPPNLLPRQCYENDCVCVLVGFALLCFCLDLFCF